MFAKLCKFWDVIVKCCGRRDGLRRKKKENTTTLHCIASHLRRKVVKSCFFFVLVLKSGVFLSFGSHRLEKSIVMQNLNFFVWLWKLSFCFVSSKAYLSLYGTLCLCAFCVVGHGLWLL